MEKLHDLIHFIAQKFLLIYPNVIQCQIYLRMNLMGIHDGKWYFVLCVWLLRQSLYIYIYIYIYI